MCFALEEFGAGRLSPRGYWKKSLAAQAEVMGPLKIDQEGLYKAGELEFYRAVTPEGVFFSYTNEERAVTLSCVVMGGELASHLPVLDTISQSFRWK
ncbi:MAG: hypothetical protein JKY56_16150 [Kofleriaceae bacterium]|nr:hypothetical protein [Kofleriaceae bacterium]